MCRKSGPLRHSIVYYFVDYFIRVRHGRLSIYALVKISTHKELILHRANINHLIVWSASLWFTTIILG